MIVLLALAGLAVAAPMELTHTGRLLDTSGLPLDGPHSISVALYPDASTSTALWQEVHDGSGVLPQVDFDNGYFSVRLGTIDGTLLDDAVFDGATRYVGISVDGSVELGRQPIVSVPYAINATTARNVVGGTIDATEIRVNGDLLLDSGGALVAPGSLNSLSCGDGEAALYGGASWGCVPFSWANLANVPPDLLDGDDDLLATTSCASGQVLSYGVDSWSCAADQVLDEAAVEAFVVNGPLSLDIGTTLAGSLISTGAHYTDADVVDGPLDLDPATTIGGAAISAGAHTRWSLDRMAALVSAGCTTVTGLPDAPCPADDASNAMAAMTPNSLASHFVASRLSSISGIKTYEAIYDLGEVRTADRVEAIGYSTGCWAEDGELGCSYAHNDNNFQFTTSVDGVSFTPITALASEACARLDDGCWVEMAPTDLRYLRVTVASGCDGCTNDDYVEYYRVSGP